MIPGMVEGIEACVIYCGILNKLKAWLKGPTSFLNLECKGLLFPSLG